MAHLGENTLACLERGHKRRCQEQPKTDHPDSRRHERFVYRVDRNDTIIHVSDNWCAFAQKNHWSAPPTPDKVIGHKLWGFIDGIETRHLYQTLFARTRAGKPPRPIPFRCDAPDKRRFLYLTLGALPDGQIEITSIIHRTEQRTPLRMLDIDAPRSAEFLRICSMCKKIDVKTDLWVEIEEALAQLKIFEADKVPRLTHGLCPECYRSAMQELDDIEKNLGAGDRRVTSQDGNHA